MSKRLLLCAGALLTLALLNLPVSKAQSIPARGVSIPISSYQDDPYVRDADIKRMDAPKFGQGVDGRPILKSARVWIQDEAIIYRENRETGEFNPFAWNPWPESWLNPHKDFRFPHEPQFPLFLVERGPDGKILLKDGLQNWVPQDLNLGSTTAYEAANAVRDAAEFWAGREIAWGIEDGLLLINAHSFIDFNAFYAPSARQLFFGLLPYRLPGQTDVKLFEMATSWEIVAHECGHALHYAIKPNLTPSDQSSRTWSESFSDQMAMWASLRQRERVQRLLAETHGDLNQSNALTRLAEAFAALVGEGTGLRDAFHDKKVSDTSTEEHDRSEVLTGASYKIFLKIYDALKCERRAEDALSEAAHIMGLFLMRSADYTPENQVTLEDVAKAYLKVDKEWFGGRYHNVLVEEFKRRELLDTASLGDWRAHEAAVPQLFLHWQWTEPQIEQMLQANLDKLGIGPEFGLKLQSVTRLNQYRPMRGPAPTIVRVQLTEERGPNASLFDNHGILVFRANGLLADYHSPLTPDEQSALTPDVFAQTQVLARLNQAQQFRLAEHGTPLALVRQPNGQWTIEARVLRGAGLNSHMEVFSLDKPHGERREIVIPPVPPDKRIHIANDLLK